MNQYQHYWGYCAMCGPMVICGKCGNNSCNGGSGLLCEKHPERMHDDACPKCDMCQSSWEFEKQTKAPEFTKEYKEKIERDAFEWEYEWLPNMEWKDMTKEAAWQDRKNLINETRELQTKLRQAKNLIKQCPEDEE